jgi:hypothetical protein
MASLEVCCQVKGCHCPIKQITLLNSFGGKLFDDKGVWYKCKCQHDIGEHQDKDINAPPPQQQQAQPQPGMRCLLSASLVSTWCLPSPIGACSLLPS